MAAQWATSALSNPLWQRSEDHRAIKTIQRLPDDQISPREAAQTIASTYEAGIRRGNDGIWYLWEAFFDAIDRCDHSTVNLERLAQTIRSLSKLPDVLDHRGQPIESQTTRQIFWRDVPSFALYISKVVTSEAPTDVIVAKYADSDRFGAMWDAVARKLLNRNTFAAVYLRELATDGLPRDLAAVMRKQAQVHLMYTLEIATDTPARLRRFEAYLPPAAAWILLVGRIIYHYSKSNQDSTGQPVKQAWVGKSDGWNLIWSGRDGFNLERWQFWKRRLQKISGLREMSGEARHHASYAAAEMQKIENEEEH